VSLAQPPLYQVSRGKKSQYVLNEAEMSKVLTDLAMTGAALVIRDEQANEVKRIQGDALLKLVRSLNRMQELVRVAERRGTPFPVLIAAREKDPTGQQRLPTHRLTWPEGEQHFWSEEEAGNYIAKHKLILDDLQAGEHAATGNGHGEHRKRLAVLRELHENRELQKIIERLAETGIDISTYSLVQQEAVTGEKLPTRFAAGNPRPSRSRTFPPSSANFTKLAVAASKSSASRALAR
jgi:DNA gyrase subunit B